MTESDPPPKKDFFISYNKADREWAEWVAWHLEETGHYSVSIQAWDFGPGSNFVLEMDRAIQECERVVAVLSPDYLTSLFTKPEWAAYFVQDSTGQDRTIIPVRVRECEPKGLLAAIVYADLVGKPENEGKATLLDAVKLGRRKPEDAPSFPGRKITSKPRFPGALPDIWNVPHLRNPNFTEPEQRLTEMHSALRSGKPTALTQALEGLGGVGKTQLAVEYAYRYAADYEIIWWVRSEQPATLASDYAALAAKLDLPEKDAAEKPVIVTAVREALQHRRDWLLVFDNVNAPEEIRNYLPGVGGHVLITSRHAGWGGVAHAVSVRKWAPEVAVDFLLKRTGHTDIDVAQELARELGFLPLALEQAAAYIDASQRTLSGYLAMFREHQLALLKRGKPSTDYPATVETTWEFAFQRLEKESPAGIALLQLCAFLAPDNIPTDPIMLGSAYLPHPLAETVNDGLAFDDAVRAIRQYSLMDPSGDSSLSMHRLVQAVVRGRLDLAARERWAGAAVKVVNKAFLFSSDDIRTWKECERILPHAVVAADFAEGLNVDLEVTARLRNQMGLYARNRGEYREAKNAFGRALKIYEGVCGPDHPNVATTATNLGNALGDLKELHEAQAAHQRALEIDEKVYGLEHPEVATDVNNLGGVLMQLGEFAAAKDAFSRALRIDEGAFGFEHPEVATDVTNLGLVLSYLGEVWDAKAAHERALKIDEKAFGPDHPTVARDLNNLGTALTDVGDRVGAKAALQRALRISENSLGKDHPNTQIARLNLDSLT